MKKKDYITLIILWPFLAAIISLLLNVTLLLSIAIFYVVPAFFISLKGKKHVKKTAIFALVIVPAVVVMDAIGHIAKSWFVPTIFPFRIFGSALEVAIWGFFTVYFIVIFYEFFLDHHITKKLYTPRLKYLLISILVILSLFIFLFINSPVLLEIPYFYLILGIIIVAVPAILGLFTTKRLLTKFFITAAYFFYFHLIYEIVALKLGWWLFLTEGQFVGWVSLLGVNFPFEELFIFVMLGALSTIAYYEFFDDDEK